MHTIRKATEKDITHVYNIYRELKVDHERIDDTSYTDQMQKDGFIVIQEKESNFGDHLQKARAFYVFMIQDTYGGFIIVNDDFAKTDHNRVWDDDSMKEAFYSPKTLVLYELGVHPAFTHHGAATALLATAEKHIKKEGYTHLVSMVPVKPYENKASLKFHEEHGFKKVAASEEGITFEDLAGYEYLMFGKKIT